MASIPADEAAWTILDLAYSKGSHLFSHLNSADMSTPPKNRASILLEQLAISYAFSSPSLVSIIMCSLQLCLFSVSKLSNRIISSELLTFGIIKAGGGVFVFKIACTSSMPNFSLRELILSILSIPSSFCFVSNNFIANFLAKFLSWGAIPSSNSTHTISVPDLIALGNISGFRPGVKIKLLLD